MINASVRIFVLDHFFPGIDFIPKSSTEKLDIDRYIVEVNGNWTLDITSMSQSTYEYFPPLFPNNLLQWDEEKAINKYGSADINKYYTDLANNEFIESFKAAFKKVSGIDDIMETAGRYIHNSFFKNIKRDRKIWEDWDFSNLVSHKRGKKDIYNAFFYYARRQYILLGIGIEYCRVSDEKPEKIIKSGQEYIDNQILINIPVLKNYFYLFDEPFKSRRNRYNLNIGTEIQVLIQHILESYEPTNKLAIILPPLIRKLRIYFKINKYRKYKEKLKEDKEIDEYFDDNLENTIDNKISKIKQCICKEKCEKYIIVDKKAKCSANIADPKVHGLAMNCRNFNEELKKIAEQEKGWSFIDKAIFIYKMIQDSNIKQYFDEREINIIQEIYLNTKDVYELFYEFGGSEDDEDDEPIKLMDIISDNKYMDPSDRIIWTTNFTDAFRTEFRDEIDKEDKLDKFLECLPELSEYLKIDDNGNISVTNHYIKELFKNFCSLLQIKNPSENFQRQFIAMIKMAINKINNEK